MTKVELVKQFRRSVRESKALRPRLLSLLDRVDDDFIFSAYLNWRCKGCGVKLGDGLDVEQILAESHSEGDFYDRCVAAMEHGHAFVRPNWPEELDANP